MYPPDDDCLFMSLRESVCFVSSKGLRDVKLPAGSSVVVSRKLYLAKPDTVIVYPRGFHHYWTHVMSDSLSHEVAMYSGKQTPAESGLPIYQFHDGAFAFITAYYGSWAQDKRVVFRVREDNTPELRAAEKGIIHWDRLYPSTNKEIDAWLASHPDFVVC